MIFPTLTLTLVQYRSVSVLIYSACAHQQPFYHRSLVPCSLVHCSLAYCSLECFSLNHLEHLVSYICSLVHCSFEHCSLVHCSL